MILPQNTEFHSEVNSRLIHSADFGECTAIGQVPQHFLLAVHFRKQVWCRIRNLAECKSPLDEDYFALVSPSQEIQQSFGYFSFSS